MNFGRSIVCGGGLELKPDGVISIFRVKPLAPFGQPSLAHNSADIMANLVSSFTFRIWLSFIYLGRLVFNPCS